MRITTARHEPIEGGQAADANRIAIAGDSVGGNMTAVVALFAKERKGPEIKRSSRTDERHPRQSNSRPLHIALERLAPPEDARRACRSKSIPAEVASRLKTTHKECPTMGI
jgi:acetyl esterase/lipase